MMGKWLDAVLRHHMLVLILGGLLACGGLYAFHSLPIDAFPDVTNTQVQILTQAPGLAPTEVERFVTFPIELQLMGIPRLTEVRSQSKFALSQVTVVFEDGMDLSTSRVSSFWNAWWKCGNDCRSAWTRSWLRSRRDWGKFISTTSTSPPHSLRPPMNPP